MPAVSPRILVLLFISIHCSAQNAASDATETQDAIENIVVTGVHSPEKLENTTVLIEVIDRDQLERLNKASLTEVLRTLPGLSINQQGGPGGIIDVSIRGSESNFVAVYIDGIQVNDPTSARGGAFNLNSINVNSIERIEVVKGAQSVVYGSDALAGAIHIITRQPTAENAQTASAEVGSNNFRETGFAVSGSGGSLGYVLDGAHLSRESDDGHSAYESDGLNGKLIYGSDLAGELQLNLRHLSDRREAYPEQSGGPDFATLDDLEEMESEEWSGAVHWQKRLSPGWNSYATLGYFRREAQSQSPGIVPFTQVPPTTDDTEYRLRSWRWVNRLGEPGKLWVNVGLDGEAEEGSSDGTVDFGFVIPAGYEMDRRVQGAFFNLNYSFSGGWLSQLGIRRDDHEDTENQTTYQAGLKSPYFGDVVSISANWGEGYKLPGFSALAHPLVGNSDLQPETSESFELAIEALLSDDSTLEFAYFANDYRNLIDFDSEQFRNVNRSQVETTGADLAWRWLPTEQISLRANATYTDIDLLGSNGKLMGRPQLSARAIANWQISDRVGIGADYRWTDSRFAGSLHSGSPERHELSPYGTSNAHLSWEINPTLLVRFAVDNLTDRDYYEAYGFPSPGRTWRLAGVIRLVNR